MKEEERRERIAAAAGRLTRLLDNPEPGLTTWHSACEAAYQEILEAARA